MRRRTLKDSAMRSKQLLSLLKHGDAEFLLKRATDGKVRIRVGQIWTISERKGETALYVDLDNCKACDRRTIRARLAKCGVVCKRILVRTSPGGNGLHVVVWVVGRFPKMDRVALQLILESDVERECQNFRRAKQGNAAWGPHWQVLFQKKGRLN